jgi:hypothetical protein
MKSILSERSIAVALFIIVIITFSFAQRDSKEIERAYAGSTLSVTSRMIAQQQVHAQIPIVEKSLSAPEVK